MIFVSRFVSKNDQAVHLAFEIPFQTLLEVGKKVFGIGSFDQTKNQVLAFLVDIIVASCNLEIALPHKIPCVQAI